MDKTFNRISGHRDANQTACPGARLYEKLPALRTAVAARVGSRSASTLDRSVDSGGTPDVLAEDAGAAYPSDPGQVLRSASTQPVRAGVRIGTGWNSLRHVVLSPDLTGDGRADIVAVRPASGVLRVYRGNGRGGFAGVEEARLGVERHDPPRGGEDHRRWAGRPRPCGPTGSLEIDQGTGQRVSRRPRASHAAPIRALTDAGRRTATGLRHLFRGAATIHVLDLRPGLLVGGVGAAGEAGLPAGRGILTR